MPNQIAALLFSLGLSSNYKGFSCLISAVDLVMRDPDSLALTTKSLYPQVAKLHHTTWQAVERNIRTAIGVIWARSAQRLQSLTCFPLSGKPSAPVFISILVYHLQNPSR